MPTRRNLYSGDGSGREQQPAAAGSVQRRDSGRHRGRPPRDLLVLLADVVVAIEAEPTISIRELSRLLRVRRESVRLVLGLLADARARRVPHSAGRS